MLYKAYKYRYQVYSCRLNPISDPRERGLFSERRVLSQQQRKSTLAPRSFDEKCGWRSNQQSDRCRKGTTTLFPDETTNDADRPAPPCGRPSVLQNIRAPREPVERIEHRSLSSEGDQLTRREDHERKMSRAHDPDIKGIDLEGEPTLLPAKRKAPAKAPWKRPCVVTPLSILLLCALTVGIALLLDNAYY